MRDGNAMLVRCDSKQIQETNNKTTQTTMHTTPQKNKKYANDEKKNEI